MSIPYLFFTKTAESSGSNGSDGAVHAFWLNIPYCFSTTYTIHNFFFEGTVLSKVWAAAWVFQTCASISNISTEGWYLERIRTVSEIFSVWPELLRKLCVSPYHFLNPVTSTVRIESYQNGQRSCTRMIRMQVKENGENVLYHQFSNNPLAVELSIVISVVIFNNEWLKWLNCINIVDYVFQGVFGYMAGSWCTAST